MLTHPFEKRQSWLMDNSVRWVIFVLLIGFQSYYFGWLTGCLTAIMFLICDLAFSRRARRKLNPKIKFYGRLAALFLSMTIVGLSDSFFTAKICDKDGNCRKIFVK